MKLMFLTIRNFNSLCLLIVFIVLFTRIKINGANKVILSTVIFFFVFEGSSQKYFDAMADETILGNAVTSQHGALLSDDIKALKTNR